MKRKILILCKTDLQRDPRVLKQIDALQNDYDIVCVGSAKSNKKGVCSDLNLFHSDNKSKTIDRITELTKLVTLQYKSLYWKGLHRKVYDELKKDKYDLIICNETESLPIADRIAYKQEIPIYCDLHEFYPDDRGMGSFSKAQQLYEEWLLINHKSHVKYFTTVSAQLMNIYRDKYQIESTVLNNACRYYDLGNKKTKTQIKLICHGVANINRRLEIMIQAVEILDENYTLDLYLVENVSTYMQHLKQLASQTERINILPPIPFHQIQRTINKYDVGLYLLYPTNINNANALPNKLFEFIQGRVALAIGPTPAMADIVNQYNIGVVAEEFTAESLAKAVKSMTIEDIDNYKQNTNKAALYLNSEKNIEEIQKIVKHILD